ncbi:putative RNA-binding protein with PIN domain [Roseimicrobium gellanilyticum]|uniref:Putative RNA-binding protein with PIN domain n=1 Tax=Roseimicrobium gellanilyticum TaxID=748857 RepID=A0A366HVX8_9BACT|nr:NYN domain-containing protein [Roseimicrobium gellanilyticum]RBP48237.1 putative RNA-binding protein with PIN domain [Roseimicrobium gellanilyticum]
MPETLKFLILDGHSVIYAWEDLRKLHLKADKRYLAREELLKRMRTLQDMRGERVVVVFDGIGSVISDSREKDDVQVFYADAGHTADALIEQLAAKYAGTYAIRVCTADRMIWDGVRASGAHWISPDMLRFEVEQAEGEVAKKIGKRR